jgi:hypothetical protein
MEGKGTEWALPSLKMKPISILTYDMGFQQAIATSCPADALTRCCSCGKEAGKRSSSSVRGSKSLTRKDERNTYQTSLCLSKSLTNPPLDSGRAYWSVVDGQAMVSVRGSR